MNDGTEPTVETTTAVDDRAELRRSLLIVAIAVAALLLRWDLLKGVFFFVLTLGVLVAIHEWGHFIAARAVGAHVYEFAIGMGPRLFTYMRRQGTAFTIRCIPMGGFVLIKGMQPDDPLTPDGLNGKRPVERALVYLAGPLMNVLFGSVLLMFMGSAIGTLDPSRVILAEVKPKLPGTRMQVVSIDGRPAPADFRRGLRVGDQVLAVNETPVTSTSTVADVINAHVDETIRMRVRRDGHELVLEGQTLGFEETRERLVVQSSPAKGGLDLRPGDVLEKLNNESVYPEERKELIAGMLMDRFKKLAGRTVSVTLYRKDAGRLKVEGIAAPLVVSLETATRKIGRLGLTPVAAQGPRIGLAQSVTEGLTMVASYFLNFAVMFSQPQVLSENVGGPIMIFQLLSDADRLPLMIYVTQLASLSLSLAVFNLLPIPVLDGGHMLILTVEVIRRRRLEPNAHRLVYTVGLAIMGLVLLGILRNDWLKYF